MAEKHSVRRLLEQHLRTLANAALQVLKPCFGADFGRAVCTRFAFGAGDLLRHVAGAGALAARVGEHMDLRKRSAPQKVEGLGKIFFRLAGESGDEIGRDGAAREVLAQKTAREQKTLGVVSPSHGAQGFVTAALQ